MADQRRIIVFSGTVQGVGFRYTACMVARGFDVTGYVCNVPGGTVEAVVEGSAAEIDAFVGEIHDRMRGYIRRTQQDTEPATGEFHEFGVRF